MVSAKPVAVQGARMRTRVRRMVLGDRLHRAYSNLGHLVPNPPDIDLPELRQIGQSLYPSHRFSSSDIRNESAGVSRGSQVCVVRIS